MDPAPSRREALPPPKQKDDNSSIWSIMWSILKDSWGKDLTHITLPFFFNEPLSVLQKTMEDLEYANLLNKVSSKCFLCVKGDVPIVAFLGNWTLCCSSILLTCMVVTSIHRFAGPITALITMYACLGTFQSFQSSCLQTASSVRASTIATLAVHQTAQSFSCHHCHHLLMTSGLTCHL